MSLALRRGTARVVHLADRARQDLLRLVDTDPIPNVVVAARLRQAGSLEPRALGGEVVGVRDPGGRLTAAVFHAGNLLPIGGGREQWHALAAHLGTTPRSCSSIVGHAAAVTAMWEVLAPAWGPARAIRAAQPLLALERSAVPGSGDRRVRPIRVAELDRYLPAATAMFTEELEISPFAGAGFQAYRRRVAAQISEGRAFGLMGPDGEVIFKADLGPVSSHTCQVHGVWVRPDMRGQGIGTAALATVLRHALTLAPTASLYVNDYNTAARRMYARLGMREVATFATVLF